MKKILPEPIPLFVVHMPKSVDKPLLEVLHSGYIGQGKKVAEFEKKLASYIGNPYVVTTNSATSALVLAHRLAGIDSTSTVLSSPITCAATNLSILANQARIMWADVDPQTGLIDPLDIKRKITRNIKAITVIDWGGTVADLDVIKDIATKYHIPVIEDAAHAFGASYKKKKVGTVADYTIFSFQAIKTLTTITGGALFCKDKETYARAKLLRWYGIDREKKTEDSRVGVDIKDWGYNAHMVDVNATIGIEQLKYIDIIIQKQRENALFYSGNLSDFYYQCWKTDYQCASTFWLYTILLPTQKLRLAFTQYMKERNIMVSQVHARNDLHTVFRAFKTYLPGVTQFMERQVSIPVHWSLTKSQRQYIVDCCNEFAHQNSSF